MICEKSNVEGYDIVIPANAACFVDNVFMGHANIHVSSPGAMISAVVTDKYGRIVCTGDKVSQDVSIEDCKLDRKMQLWLTQTTNFDTNIRYGISPTCSPYDFRDGALSSLIAIVMIGTATLMVYLLCVVCQRDAVRERDQARIIQQSHQKKDSFGDKLA